MAKIQKFTDKGYTFSSKVSAVGSHRLNRDIFFELFSSFSCTASELVLSECEESVFIIGDVQPLDTNGYEYAIRVCEDGVAISAEGQIGLIHGYYALLEMIEPVCLEYGREELYIPGCEIWERGDTEYRMAHFCLFARTELWELEKFIRVCAVLKCTHIVLESWGSIRLDALPEMAWEGIGHTKDEIRPYIKLANDMGIEIVPFFNHWGHASQARGRIGKHAILNQNPRLATLFNRTGWAWRIDKREVRDLHARIREELMELCGDGSFFHIGCDEAVVVSDTSVYEGVVEYINEISSSIGKRGRRTLMWGDMMLLKSRFDPSAHYECNVKDERVEKIMIEGVSKDVIIVDWQYNAVEHPFKTSEYLKSCGFEVMCAPWNDKAANGACAVKTAKELSLLGVMHTSWHTMYEGYRPLNLVLRRAWDVDYDWNDENIMYVGALVGKAHPTVSYEQAGWAREEIALGFK